MNPVVQFEMPYDDRDRMARFYESAFGWQMQKLGAEMGSYISAATGETGADGWPLMPGTINGGFFERKAGWPAQAPSVVIAVNDIQAAIAQVAASGGTVVGEPMLIADIGQYLSSMDTENNRVSLLHLLPRG